ncbi:MAG: LytTR family transcriptional regulator [Bacteroidales bacterium]|nr:LytTR family transcriptional regulator [Bacteroidales bacterium]MBR5704324.1 LytTR family transcriptional regulator [Bacteroidales bacterium]
MKTLARIAFWLVALALLAAILVSLDYSLAQAVFISLLFCPCALALERFMPTARKPMDKVYLSLAVLVSVVLLILVLHHIVWARLNPEYGYIEEQAPVSPMLINPVFLGLILTVLSIGDFFWAKWLGRRFKEKDRSVTFFSDRKSVTLRLADIAYVESNDTEVRIVTAAGESYRNKTGISQWENLLGEGFLRIHRSYLVNAALATLSTPDTVSVGDAQLPVSRKYRDIVAGALAPDSRDKD